ncbi:MAG: hypothetical protein EP326_00325 [Deltaproteobacteria bacterium]|nr:MAG: hypothetical protein EP326_00325 [Deltaproteobacteria bacterium]
MNRLKWTYILFAILILVGQGCVGTIEDKNPKDTKTAVAGGEPPTFAGITEARPISHDRVEVYFFPSPGNPKDLTYKIVVNSNPNPIKVKGDALNIAQGGAYVYTVSGLTVNTEYTFAVGVIDGISGKETENDKSLRATTFSNYTATFAGISSVTPKAGLAGQTTVNVNWVPATILGSQFFANDRDPVGYEIRFMRKQDGPPQSIYDANNPLVEVRQFPTSFGTNPKPDFAATQEIGGLLPGTEYYFLVRAIHKRYVELVIKSDPPLAGYKREENGKIASVVTLEAGGVFDWPYPNFQADPAPGEAGLGTVNFSWEPAVGPYTNYRIYLLKLTNDKALVQTAASLDMTSLDGPETSPGSGIYTQIDNSTHGKGILWTLESAFDDIFNGTNNCTYADPGAGHALDPTNAFTQEYATNWPCNPAECVDISPSDGRSDKLPCLMKYGSKFYANPSAEDRFISWAGLQKFSNYRALAFVCEDTACNNRLQAQEKVFRVEPNVAPFSGVLFISDPQSATEKDIITVNFDAPVISSGYLTDLELYCFDGPNDTSPVLIPEDGTTLDPTIPTPAGHTTKNNCDWLRRMDPDPGSQNGFSTFTKIRVQHTGRKAPDSPVGEKFFVGSDRLSDRSYCFGAVPTIVDADSGFVYRDISRAIVRCKQLEIKTPSLVEFTGANSGCYAGADNLDVKWTTPTGGIYTNFILFYRNNDGSAFQFSEAIDWFKRSEVDGEVDNLTNNPKQYKYVDGLAKTDTNYMINGLIPGETYQYGVLAYIDDADKSKYIYSKANQGIRNCGIPLPVGYFQEWIDIFSIGPKTDSRIEENKDTGARLQILETLNKYGQPIEVQTGSDGLPENGQYATTIATANVEPTTNAAGFVEQYGNDITQINDFDGVPSSWNNEKTGFGRYRYSNTGIVAITWKDILFDNKSKTFYDLIDEKGDNCAFAEKKCGASQDQDCIGTSDPTGSVQGTSAGDKYWDKTNRVCYSLGTNNGNDWSSTPLTTKANRKYGYKVYRSDDNRQSWKELTKYDSTINFLQSPSNSGLLHPSLLSRRRRPDLPIETFKGVRFVDYSVQYAKSSGAVDRAKVYHYRITPVFNGVELKYEREQENPQHIIEVIVPPPNMAFVSRIIANKNMCDYLGKSICEYSVNTAAAGDACNDTDCIGNNDPTTLGVTGTADGNKFYNVETNKCYVWDNTATSWTEEDPAIPLDLKTYYTCKWNGIGATASSEPIVLGQTVYDFKSDMLMDRFELGCNYTRGDRSNLNSYLDDQGTFLDAYRFLGLSKDGNKFKGCYFRNQTTSLATRLDDIPNNFPPVKGTAMDNSLMYRVGDCIGTGSRVMHHSAAGNDCGADASTSGTTNYTFKAPGAGTNLDTTNCQSGKTDDEKASSISGRYFDWRPSTNDMYKYTSTAIGSVAQSEAYAVYFDQSRSVGDYSSPGVNFPAEGGRVFNLTDEGRSPSNCYINLSMQEPDPNLPGNPGGARWIPRWIPINHLDSITVPSGTPATKDLFSMTLAQVEADPDLYGTTDAQVISNTSLHDSKRYFADLPFARIAITNEAKLPPAAGLSISQADKICKSFKVEKGFGDDASWSAILAPKSKRLMRRTEGIVASIFPKESSWNSTKVTEVEQGIYVEPSDDPGGDDYEGGCNSYTKATPDGDPLGRPGVIPNTTMWDRDGTGTIVRNPYITGSSFWDNQRDQRNNNSELCTSAFGIQDLVGNMMEFSSERMFCNFDGEQLYLGDGNSTTRGNETNSILIGSGTRYLGNNTGAWGFEAWPSSSADTGRCSIIEKGSTRTGITHLIGGSFNNVFDVFGNLNTTLVADGSDARPDARNQLDQRSVDFLRNGDGWFLDSGQNNLLPPIGYNDTWALTNLGPVVSRQGLFGGDPRFGEFFSPVAGLPITCANINNCDQSPDNTTIHWQSKRVADGSPESAYVIPNFPIGNSQILNDGMSEITGGLRWTTNGTSLYSETVISDTDPYTTQLINGTDPAGLYEVHAWWWRFNRSMDQFWLNFGSSKFQGTGRYSLYARGLHERDQKSQSDTGARCVIKLDE